MAEMIGKDLWSRINKANEDYDIEMLMELLAMAQLNVCKGYVKFVKEQVAGASDDKAG